MAALLTALAVVVVLAVVFVGAAYCFVATAFFETSEDVAVVF
jgi:hypothetical protein